MVLEYGVTVGGKTVREHLEVPNLREAWERLKGAVTPGTPLTEDLVLDIHKVLMQGILGDDAGRYRRPYPRVHGRAAELGQGPRPHGTVRTQLPGAAGGRTPHPVRGSGSSGLRGYPPVLGRQWPGCSACWRTSG